MTIYQECSLKCLLMAQLLGVEACISSYQFSNKIYTEEKLTQKMRT